MARDQLKPITFDRNKIFRPETVDRNNIHSRQRLETKITQKINDVDTCLEMSRNSKDPHIALEYIQRAIDLTPDDSRVHAMLLNLLRTRLNEDPYILFLAETEKNYIVTFRHARPIIVPKTRGESEIFPSRAKTDGERLLGMIWWMALGLVPAGLGAVILFPSVMTGAFDVLTRRGAVPRDQRMAWVALVLACMLGGGGIILSFLLFLHLLT